MKITTTLLLCFSAVILQGAVPLVKNGKALSKIYVSKNASSGEKTAAKELQEYFKKSSGAVFAVTHNLKDAKIILGTGVSKEIPSAMRNRLKGKKEEGFLFKTEKGKLYIIGNGQVGTLYGAYTFLDKFLDVRWFLPGEEYVGKKKDLVIPELDKIEEPSFLLRQVSQTGAGGQARASKSWAARNRLQCTSAFVISALYDPKQKDYFDARIAAHVNAEGGHLAFYRAIPPRKYLKTHPHYFALVNGKRLTNRGHHNTHHCLSNVEVQKLVADYICSLIDKYGNRIAYNFGAPDTSINWCECKNCKALDNKNSRNYSQRFHTVSKKIAQMVYKRKPNARLILWVYAIYRSLPDIKIDQRMILNFCTHGRCFAHTLDDPSCFRNVKIFSLMKKWLKKNPTMRVYEYAHCTPMSWTPLERVLSSDLKLYKKLGISGWKEEISFPEANWRKKAPVFEENPRHGAYTLGHEWLYWNVAGKLTWNEKLDVNKVIADIESKYYGRAYKVMKRFNDLRRQSWDNATGCFGYPDRDDRTAGILMKEGVREELLSLLAQAEKIAAKDPVIMRRLKRDRVYLTKFWIEANDRYRARQSIGLYAPGISAGQIKIDGDPGDPAWAKASYLSNFRTLLKKPNFDLPTSLKTTVGVLSDKENLYFLFIANEPSLDKLKAEGKKDGKVWADDGVEVLIDPKNEANCYYQIAVNTKGTVFDARQPNSDTKVDFGVKAACKIFKEKKMYVVEMKVPVKNMEGVFAPGVIWNVHFARNRKIKDGLFEGSSALNGDFYHDRSAFRSLTIGSPLIKNGNFNIYHTSGRHKGKLKAWKCNKLAVPVKEGRTSCVVMKRGGQFYQNLWSMRGPLKQSDKAKKLKILIRASGSGTLNIATLTYQDTYVKKKMKRKHYGWGKVGTVKLSNGMKTHTFEYTIPAHRWIALYLQKKDKGEAKVEGVSIIKE